MVAGRLVRVFCGDDPLSWDRLGRAVPGGVCPALSAPWSFQRNRLAAEARELRADSAHSFGAGDLYDLSGLHDGQSVTLQYGGSDKLASFFCPTVGRALL